MEKEVSEAERRVEIKKDYFEKIRLLLDQEVDDKGLLGLIRHFFADFLKLEYEFTYEELSKEMNKVFVKQSLKQRIDRLLNDLSLFEYTPDHDLTQDEKKDILNDLKEIIDQLIIDLEERPKKKSFMEKIFGKSKDEEKKEEESKDIKEEGKDLKSLPNLPEIEKDEEMLHELREEVEHEEQEEQRPSFNQMIKSDSSGNMLLFTEDNNPKATRPVDTPAQANPVPGQAGQAAQGRTVQRGSVQRQMAPKPVRTAPARTGSTKELPRGANNMMPKFEPPPVSDDGSKQPGNQARASKPNPVMHPVPVQDATQSVHESRDTAHYPSMLTEDNDPVMIRLKESIEQSYAELSAGNANGARVKYMEALASYNTFDYIKKSATYLTLYELYKRLIG